MSQNRRQPSFPGSLPGSVLATSSATRRSVLAGGLGIGAAALLAACGGDSSTPTPGASGAGSGTGAAPAGGGTVKFGINEAKGSGPAYTRLADMATAYQTKTGTQVALNAVDHNTFQESINTYLQGTPDDVFTWFAGFRMAQFAESQLIADLSDVWPLDGIGEAFKKASTAADGKQYFVPVSYYPWAVFYRKSVFEKNGWTVPKTQDELTALMKDMQGKKMTPFAFAAKDAWAPMGTFDILNMRLNGYEFHQALTAGEKKWDSPEVKRVFETWKTLLPYHQTNSLGRTWQEAATSMAKGETGMYLLGTFVVDAIADVTDDLDFFTFPALDATIGSDALDAPIDGFCVSAASENADRAKAFVKWLASAEAADAANAKSAAPMIAANSAASTAKYGALQKKSVEVVQQAKSIAQFLDRDTNADLANTVIAPAIQEFIKSPDKIDAVTSSIQKQAESILQ